MSEDEEIEVDVPDAVYNLAAALSCLEEIDTGLMGKGAQSDLQEIRRNIFNALKEYSSML